MDDLLSARPGAHNRTASYEDTGSERGINFTMFLTMMSERLFEFDTEAELLEAFGSFDENDSGMVRVDEMKKWLGEVGERMDEQEVRDCDVISTVTDCVLDGSTAEGTVHGQTGQFQLQGVGQGAACE